LATPDGRTLYFTASDNESTTHAYAVDPSTYAPKGAWTWQPDVLQIGFPAPVACNADGSLLLMAGFGGLVVIDVADGFVPTGTLSIAKQLNLFPGRPAVSPDNSRAYALAVDNPQDPAHGHVLAIDVDLAAGSLSLAKDIPLGLVPYYYHTVALSPDAKTLYVLTGTDVLTAYDTSTYAAVPYQCGVNGDFTPLQIVPGAQPNVLYCIGHDGDTSGTVSIVTVP
jgi:sugar lactone lactonase YvrE